MGHAVIGSVFYFGTSAAARPVGPTKSMEMDATVKEEPPIIEETVKNADVRAH
jgi:hypothetical protein